MTPDASPDQDGLLLIANDQEWTARSLETILQAAGYRVVRTFTGQETLAVARQRQPDLLILDVQLPDLSGLDICRTLRADPRVGPGTPVILTTAGPSGRPQRLAAYEAGAWEFYGQPLDGPALLHKVRIYLEARHQFAADRRGALVDFETGAYTRLGLRRRAEEVAGEARRRGESLACVVLDSPGMLPMADLPARLVGGIRASIRPGDAVGRVGPSSFAVVGAMHPDGAHPFASRLADVVGRIPDAGAPRLGVMVARDVSLLDPDALLDGAVEAMVA